MRDKRRIALILDQIERLWESAPDLRYFQLMNALSDMYTEENDASLDLYYLEDDNFLEWLTNKTF